MGCTVINVGDQTISDRTAPFGMALATREPVQEPVEGARQKNRKCVITSIDSNVPTSGALEHISVLDVGQTKLPMRSAGSTENVQGYREKMCRPSHGISRAFDYWEQKLADYPDLNTRDKVLDSVKYGYDIGFRKDRKIIHSDNWKSANNYSTEVSEFIHTHMHDGSVELVPIPSAIFRTSPLGAFMKKNSQKVRVVHDLSWPAGESTNDGISKDEFSVSYSSIDDAVQLCMKYDQAWLAKSDLKDAYRFVPCQNS